MSCWWPIWQLVVKLLLFYKGLQILPMEWLDETPTTPPTHNLQIPHNFFRLWVDQNLQIRRFVVWYQ
jgi:hypothetical protein